MIREYREAYKTDDDEYIYDEDETFEEIVCDALGGINIFENTTHDTETYHELFDEIRAYNTENKSNSTRGPPRESGVKSSIETLPDGKKYVRADRQVIFGNDPESWCEQLEDYINGKIRRGQDVQLIAEDGDVLTLTAKTAGKVASPYKDGRTMSVEEYARKVSAGSHIDELVQVSKRGNKIASDVDGRHGEMASEGWNYRTAYFLDFDGKYYRCRISVALGSDGKLVYNIGAMEERSFPTARKALNGSSANSGALGREASSSESVTDSNGKVKTSLERESDYDGMNGVMFSREQDAVRKKPAPKKVQWGFKLMNVDKNGLPHAMFIDSAAAFQLNTWYDASAPNMSDLEKLEPGYAYLVDADGNADIATRKTIEKTKNGFAKLPGKVAVNAATADGKRWMVVSENAKGERKYHNVGINGSGTVSVYALRPGLHAVDIPSMRHIGAKSNGVIDRRRPDQRWFLIEYPVDVDYNQEAYANDSKDIQDHLPTDGWYSFQTNSGAEKHQHWFITGAMKIVGAVSEQDARAYAKQQGFEADLEWKDGKSYDDSKGAIDLMAYAAEHADTKTPSKDEMRRRIEAERDGKASAVKFSREKSTHKTTQVSKQVWSQIQRQRMLKYGNKFDTMPSMDYIFANDNLFVINNYDETSFTVARKIDPAKDKAIADKIVEAFKNGSIETTRGFDRWVKVLRNNARRGNGNNVHAGDGRAAGGDARLDDVSERAADGGRIADKGSGDNGITYYGDWYEEGVDYNEAVNTVVNDINRGVRANEVEYGRQDVDWSKAMENRGKNRQHGQKFSREPNITDAMKHIQSMGRVSINDFTSEDIERARPFAEKYWAQMGVKSPFFRAWFGDWRANDNTTTPIIRANGGDFKAGKAVNRDTGTTLSWGDVLKKETFAHQTSGGVSSRVLGSIEDIVKNSVLLDTYTSSLSSKTKLQGTAFMHSYYAIVNYEGTDYLLKLFAEEAVSLKNGEIFTRAYELKDIKKVAALPNGALSKFGGLTDDNTSTGITVADIVSLVKKYDKSYNPKPASKIANDDGTPTVVYHGTTANFTVFKRGDVGFHVGTEEQARHRVRGLDGAKIMPLYASIKHPLEIEADYGDWSGNSLANRFLDNGMLEDYPGAEDKLRETLEIDRAAKGESAAERKNRAVRELLQSLGYDGIKYLNTFEGDGNSYSYIAFESTQLKSATDNIGTYDRNNPDINYSREPETLNELRRQNKMLRERVEYWKGQTKPAKEKTLNKNDVHKLAMRLKEIEPTDLKTSEIEIRLNQLGRYILNTKELRFTDVAEMAEDLAWDIVDNMSVKTEAPELELHNDIKSTQLALEDVNMLLNNVSLSWIL